MTETITSVNNPKIKDAAKLLKSAPYRRETGRFIAEGLRLCTDAALSGISVEAAFVTADALAKHADALSPLLNAAERIYVITENVCDRLSDTKTAQGVFAVCAMPGDTAGDAVDPNGTYIAADHLQNPANLGALCRTAEALGLDGVLIGGGCDIYNPKTLRASMGAMFRLPCYSAVRLADILSALSAKGMTLLAAVPDAGAQKITALRPQGGKVCVVGNEGNGISDEVLAVCHTRVTIPMRGRAESLNAAAAAAILMWELVRNDG
ncbi:MAG: RNA methyltransferase [Clostridia bacterium]|nr:RNA methyltransferase [Clostridia bacterium]